MDKILIRELEAYTIIGIHDRERQKKQPVFANIELEYSIDKAITSDDINDTLDYQELCSGLTEHIEKSRYQLIEKLADSCCQWIFQNHCVESLTLTLHKPEAIENTQSIAISIKRNRTDYEYLITPVNA